MNRGKFITFEGPEGSGKSTQVKMLTAFLESKGLQVLCTREPGGTPTGEAIRDILQHDAAGEPLCSETEMLLFEASRAQLVRHHILPSLEQGIWVLCDRFADSTTAYQGYGRGFEVDTVLAINDFAVGEAVPDRTFLLDLTIEEGFERVHKRPETLEKGLDRIEREGDVFHQKVRDGYLALAQRYPDRFVVVDAARAPEAIQEDIRNHVGGTAQ